MTKAIKTFVLLMAIGGTVPAQSFPEGEGKALVMDKCAGCHSLEEVWAHQDSADGWAKLVAYMVSRGMAATADEVKQINRYLAEAFPEEKKNSKQ